MQVHRGLSRRRQRAPEERLCQGGGDRAAHGGVGIFGCLGLPVGPESSFGSADEHLDAVQVVLVRVVLQFDVVVGLHIDPEALTQPERA